MTFPPRHIFVPVAVAPGEDLALAEHLVDAACDLAKPAGAAARLTIAYVNTPQYWMVADTGFAPPSYYQAMGEIVESNRKAAGEMLAKLAKRADDKGVKATWQMIDPTFGTGEAIAHAAHDCSADLIALWSHGRRGIKRMFLGSVAERVAHVATLPVLILRAPPP